MLRLVGIKFPFWRIGMSECTPKLSHRSALQQGPVRFLPWGWEGGGTQPFHLRCVKKSLTHIAFYPPSASLAFALSRPSRRGQATHKYCTFPIWIPMYLLACDVVADPTRRAGWRNRLQRLTPINFKCREPPHLGAVIAAWASHQYTPDSRRRSKYC